MREWQDDRGQHSFTPWPPTGHIGTLSPCHSIWDSPNARVSDCAIPWVATIPAVVIVVVAVVYLWDHFLPRSRPEWTRPFVEEACFTTAGSDADAGEANSAILGPRKRSLRWTIVLVSISVLGAAANLTQVTTVSDDAPAVYLLVSWVAAAVVIAVKRPATCPAAMMLFYLFTLVAELVTTTARPSHDQFSTPQCHYVAAAASAVALIVLLWMPLRDPSQPTHEISPVGQVPGTDLRSPEDNLRLWQFLTVSWMAPLMCMGQRRQLNEDDVWYLGFEFQHQRLHEKFRQLKGSVLGRLLQANGFDVFIVSTIAIVQMVCDFSTPVLLQQLLQAMESPGSPKRVPLTYAALSLALRLVAAQSQVFNLWYGRRCYERSRGEMVMMVYEKALSRKNVVGGLVTEKQETEQPDLHGTTEDNVSARQPKSRSWCAWRSGKRSSDTKPAKEAASMGKIFNLLRGDVYEVAQRFWEVDILVDKPIGLVIATVLVWQLFGPSCFLGILAILVAQAINAIITRQLLRWERVRRAATDARLQISSQFVEAIRHLRWYGWQNHWLTQVMDARQHELKLRILTSLWNIAIRFINTFASGLFPVVALYAYTLLAGHSLRIDIIFPALQLFAMLETRLREIPTLITAFINATIALGRIEDFMAEPDKEQQGLEDAAGSKPLRLESCSFAWPGRQSAMLFDITLTIPEGLTVICGKVGAGKSAFLQALLGELDLLGGDAHIPSEMVGYCAQTPWLQSMSVRDNILFSAPYDEQRYKRVLDACALLPDLAQLQHGDLSFIGENGIGLSGGQKARVALARALYSHARILLLDDPISALDQTTAESLVRKCFSSSLIEGRIVVLATHRTDLVWHLADQVVNIVYGHAEVLGRDALLSAVDGDSESSPSAPNGQGPAVDEDAMLEEEAAAVPDKFIEEEHRAEWGVQAQVYWTYVKSGKLKWWAALVVVLTVYRLAAVGQSWFLKEWGEAYQRILFSLWCTSWNWGINAPGRDGSPALTITLSAPPVRGNLPPPEENVRPWLLAFFLITSFQSVTLLIAQLLMLVIVYCAGRTLFRRVLERVTHATFRFFDVTPVGRLMNRLTSDIGVVDGNISEQFQLIAFQAITWVSSVVVIASVTPAFLALSLILTAAFVTVFLRFLPTSQSLRRLEMVSLSPLLSNFGELLHGLTTVRAFHAEVRFQNRVIAVVDKFQGMDHFYWSLQSWLMYRFEGLSALSTFCLTVLALYTDVSPGLVAFVLIAANSFVASTHALCKQYGQLQMDFVSVERVDELLHIEQEPPGTIDPPASWPKYGSDIVFDNVSIRYAPHLDPSLSHVSLRIPGGSTTAVTGRTGSGKSTMAVSLLSVIRPESGRILIDDIDIAHVNTQALRTRVTFVAQDPVLFPGTIRLNLDPTGEFSDEDCADVLHRIGSRHQWTLQTHVEAGGRNLSQGQRQLIGLTRAVLRRSPIVIFDEATASIDRETSLEIQEVIRQEMKQSTVITIAHRLEAIKDANYYVVLDQGRVSRHGPVDTAKP